MKFLGGDYRWILNKITPTLAPPAPNPNRLGPTVGNAQNHE